MKNLKFLAMLLFTALVSSAWATNKTLSGSESYKAQNGDVLTGLTSGTVTIANGAKITLSDVTISGGIVCSGTAEITLVGTNSVSGATNMAGIQVGGSGTTLTIKGNGSLTANGADNSAGIGLSSAWDVNATGGDIVIEGGNITATGNGMGAGIGTGLSFGDDANHTATIGNITIKGGTVTAIGGTNQYFPGSGIGKGGAYSYGNTVVGSVTITTDIDLVEASSISQSVTYKHGETDVTSIASDYFTINEDGNRRVIVPKDDTDYTITIADGIEHGTLTGATTAKYMEMVTITTTPDFGYRLSRLVVKDAENNDVSSTSNTFLMPKGNVTVSAVFEQGTHGTTEFEWRFLTDGPYSEVVETIYDGLTTVNLQQGWSCQIRKYAVNSYSKFFLDNNTYQANIPYSGGTGAFYESGMNTKFSLDSEAPAGYYDITMTDAGNGRWNVSILKTAGQIDVVPDQTYTGSAITPEPTVVAGSLNLTKGTDYVYSYMNNTNAGTATVRATFQGDYASLGYVEKTFRIIKLLTHSDITIATIPDQTYSGSEICPEISVKDGETTLILGTDYTIECANNVSAGTANMTITGMGDYPGSVSKTFEITKAPLTITAKDKTITYGDEPANDGVEYNGFLGSDDASVLGGTLTYGYNYEIWNDTGEYTITPNGLTADNYNITFVNGTLTVEPKRRKFAAVTIEDDQDGTTAVLDCSYDRDDEINLPEYEEGIKVNAIKVKRTFGIKTPATIVLPFKLPTETRTNADFYDLYSVEQVGNTWKARMEKISDGDIQPLHPYAIIVYEEELTFDLQGKDVTVYMDENEIDTVKSQDKLWYFVGVYQYKTWGGDEDKELGLAYAFAGRNEHNIAKGQFGKIAAGGYAYPLRAYLRKKDASVQLKPVQNRPLASGEQRAASVANLFNEDNTPETIEVEFFEKDQNGEEHTTFIARMDTRTGEFSSIRPSRIFDLKGRHVGKPKAKGAYFKK